MSKYNKQRKSLTVWLGDNASYDRRMAALDTIAVRNGLNRSTLIQQIADGLLQVSASQPIDNRPVMKKETKTVNDSDMLDEYNFTRGIRGKCAERYAEGTNIVVLSPDVAEVFHDSESVNEALRALINIARRTSKKGLG